MCLVFETLGLSLYDVIKNNDYKRLPLSLVRDISRQLLDTMSFLKSINLIHTGWFAKLLMSPYHRRFSHFSYFSIQSLIDLKLENVLFVHSTLREYNVVQNGRTYTIMAPEKSRIKCNSCFFSFF